MADTSELSSFSLSELPVDQSRSPTVIHGPYVPLSTSTPVHMPSDNQQTTEAAQDESPFQQVIPNVSQQSLYPSLVAIGTRGMFGTIVGMSHTTKVRFPIRFFFIRQSTQHVTKSRVKSFTLAITLWMIWGGM